jgi:iron(III) transport system ATP-binding protein
LSLDSLVPRLDADVRSLDDGSAHSLLTIRNLKKEFTRADGTKVPAVDGISLEVKAGEFIVLLGPSGCGKTTLLRCIGGLEMASEGQIEIGDQIVFDASRRLDVAARRRGVSMVFQSYALWPNMTVAENVAYPLKSKRAGKRDKAEIKAAVEEICQIVGVHEVMRQYPGHISGGQQQRVALARALVSGCALVLFDEPLSNVDAKVRKELRIELAALQGKFGFAAVYVTHDQDDAMELAHRIVVLEAGRIAQVGSPEEIYHNPVSKYVAGFVGSSNPLDGKVVAVSADGVDVETSLGTWRSTKAAPGLAVGAPVDVMFRPQHGRVHLTEPDAVNKVRVTLRRKMNSGTHAELILTHGHSIYQVRVDADFEMPENDEAWLVVDPRHLLAFGVCEPVGATA